MIKYKRKRKTIEEPDVIICDRCKKEFLYDDDEVQEFLEISFVGGYFSAWGDGIRVDCDLCSECSKEILAPFSRTENIWDDAMPQ